MKIRKYQPNQRHEFTRREQVDPRCNCDEIERALDEWPDPDEYSGHHGDCVATNFDPIPPRSGRIDHVVTIGLWCARCSKPSSYVHFWEQNMGRHRKRGQMPLCTQHAGEEAMGRTDHNETLYRPEVGDPFVTWLEVTLQVFQRYFVGLKP